MTIIPELVYSNDLKKVLKFSITPEDEGDDNQNEKTYDFDWEVVGLDKQKSTIDFQLLFAKPDAISLGDTEDSISVDVLDRRYFQPNLDQKRNLQETKKKS